MNRRAFAFLALSLALLAAGAAQAQVKTSGFPAASAIGASDLFPVSQGTCPGAACHSYKATGTQLLAWANSGISITLTVPTGLSVSGSPASGSGTLAISWATESANRIFAGPTTGSPATPTFRALVGADLPNPAASTLGGIESYAAVTHQFLTSISTSGVPASAQPAASDLSNGVTGSGAVALATSPTFVTPTLGVATVTTIAGLNAVSSITAGSSSVIGTGGTVVCAAGHTCTSLSGELTVATGTGSTSAGAVATVNFADTRANAPNCVQSNFHNGGAGNSANPSTSTTALTVGTLNALALSTTYTVDYACFGN